ncbi:hypothetical protein [Flavobacterium filum]|uniref:hypothetical protein n=1 Tax=Flavobacterium filum TaxID=370974 RepID=UPI0023EFF9E3|nr:hypothetical protein [Flavobacterium filum]
MARTRQDRRNDFDEFHRTAVATFTRFRDNDTTAKKFERIYMLSICPGSRAGGTNDRVVEVFWGSRPFRTITLGRTWTALTEYGATLLFERDDNEFVIISIYPANTDNRKPIESSISLKLWVDPIKLRDESYLKELWNDFMAYMEYTSLDGNPTIIQRLRISYLRYFKHLVIDNKWTPTKFSVSVSRVRDLVVAACFSGAVLVYFVNLTTQSKTTETDNQLKEVNKKLETVSKQLDKISDSNSNADIKSISISVDSIELKTKQILKTIKK